MGLPDEVGRWWTGETPGCRPVRHPPRDKSGARGPASRRRPTRTRGLGGRPGRRLNRACPEAELRRLPDPGAREGLSTVFTTTASLDLSWEIDLWRRLRADAQAALADLQTSAADLRGAQLSLAGQTVKVWFAIAEAQQQVLLSETSVDSFRGSADLVRERFESGIRPALDLRLALLNLANAEALLDQRRQQLDSTQRKLTSCSALAAGEVERPADVPAPAESIPGVPQPRHRPPVAAERGRRGRRPAEHARRQFCQHPPTPPPPSPKSHPDALPRPPLPGFVGTRCTAWQGGGSRAQISGRGGCGRPASYVTPCLYRYAR